ncbi:MAG: hypothetical protein PF484_02140 [Bacteroidales bacterium]|nr:hypothetical protein [Bacteroidales bacterium]
MKRHIDTGADCIYRYKFGMSLLDINTLKTIDLIKLLNEQQSGYGGSTNQ